MSHRFYNSNSAILLRYLVALVTAITFLFGLATVLAVGSRLYSNLASNADEVVKQLEETVIDSDRDWQNWGQNNSLNPKENFVHVINNRAHAKVKNYYSPGTARLTKRATAVTKHLYHRGDDFYYRTSGKAAGIHYVLWVSLKAPEDVLKTVAITIGACWLLVVGLAPLYITPLADYLTKPLLTLNRAAKEKRTKQLPVPARPTEVHELAESFNQLLAELYEKADREQRFVSNAAHELKTPIATIHSHVRLIERHQAAHPEVVSQSLPYINQETAKMEHLVDELLLLARSDAAMAVQPQEVDLMAALTDWVATNQAHLSQQIEMTGPAQLAVTTDPAYLERIVAVLLANAGKYAPANSQVTLTVTATKKAVAIAVADQGPGIDPADLPHLFERFYRGAAVRGTIAGTGLGLAIASRLASLLQGKLTVANRPEGGARFTLILPRTLDQAA